MTSEFLKELIKVGKLGINVFTTILAAIIQSLTILVPNRFVKANKKIQKIIDMLEDFDGTQAI